jgi:hypothetical protein
LRSSTPAGGTWVMSTSVSAGTATHHRSVLQVPGVLKDRPSTRCPRLQRPIVVPTDAEDLCEVLLREPRIEPIQRSVAVVGAHDIPAMDQHIATQGAEGRFVSVVSLMSTIRTVPPLDYSFAQREECSQSMLLIY